MRSKAAYGTPERLAALIAAARGRAPSDLVLRGARWLDVYGGAWMRGDVAIKDGVIVGVGEHYEGHATHDADGTFVVPGFIDAHVHIESSLMTPRRFAEAVLPCGTTAVIWDPHEIANVWGTDGIAWALAEAESVPLDVFVMVPSCVPSTSPSFGLETSGAALSAPDLEPFRSHPRVLGLAEMMNFPGLLGGDADVLAKLVAFGDMRRDGHCPGLTGKDLCAYGVAGIHTCHESTTLEEAREKLGKGIHVLVREGSCAKNADTLLPLLDAYTSATLAFCSDDRNPLDIATEGHVNAIVDRALKRGVPARDVFRAASYAPARLYGLDDRGAVAPGLVADLVLVKPRRGGDDFSGGVDLVRVLKAGVEVGVVLAKAPPAAASPCSPSTRGPNLRLSPAEAAHFRVPAPAEATRARVRVIGVVPGQIVTTTEVASLAVVAGDVAADPASDVLKIAVLERHRGSDRRAVAFVKGFGLHSGAIATSINHDSHNVIVVGGNEGLMAKATRALLAIDGGIVVVHADGRVESLSLPIGGLMTDQPPEVVAGALARLKVLAHAGGCRLDEPFLTLSFLALPVIPSLKLTDQGLVDVASFQLVPVLLEDQSTR